MRVALGRRLASVKRWWRRLAAVLLLAAGTPLAAAPRVVTLAPHLAEIVCAAGGCADLVGVSAYTVDPRQAAALPHIGDAFAVNLEAVLALRPTLILAWDGGTPPDTVARLRALGLNARWVRIGKPEDVAQALLAVGRRLGTETTAQRAARDYLAQLQSLRQRYAYARPIRYFYQLGTAPAYTISARAPLAQALAICGGVDAFPHLAHLAEPVSAEAVARAAPQVVLYGRDDDAEAIARYWARLPATPAARAGNLFAVDGGLLAKPGPRLPQGLAAACTTLDHARANLAAVSAPARAAR